MTDSIKLLMEERDRLISQKHIMNEEIDNKINALEDSIEKLSGGRIEFDNVGAVRYNDDTDILGTEDGI